VTSLGENDVEVAVSVEIAKAGVGAGLGGFLERHAAPTLTVRDEDSEQDSADS